MGILRIETHASMMASPIASRAPPAPLLPGPSQAHRFTEHPGLWKEA